MRVQHKSDHDIWIESLREAQQEHQHPGQRAAAEGADRAAENKRLSLSLEDDMHGD